MPKLQESSSAVKSIPTAKKRVPCDRAHCRVCGATRPGASSLSAEQRIEIAQEVIEHIKSAHPEHYRGTSREFDIALTQGAGNDSRCLFHGTDKGAAQ